MKNIYLLCCLIFFFSTSYSSEEKLKWKTNFEVAKKESKESKKKILIFFSGSDWCINCMKLKKRVLSTDKFIAFAKKNFILLNADFPIKKKNKLSKEQTKINETLAEKFNPKGTSPALAIVDQNGKQLGALNGYKNESIQEVLDYLKKIIDKKK
ncbi:MAG: thiol-disulfide isomerase [Planctomycetota bacterium]|nr:MAG: thiol-disulfide isomerase [Planctomycetota bacterium]